MNAEIETALVAYLHAALPSQWASLHIVPAANAGERPVAVPVVIVQVPSVTCVVEPLYDAALTLMIETPVLQGATVASHSALVRAVELAINLRAVAGRGEEDLADLFALRNECLAAAEFSSGGAWVEGPRDSHQKEAWFTTLEVKLGLRRL